MRLRIDRKHMSQPAGGWGYVVPSGPVLSDEKLGGLIEKLSQYRRNNGIPRGDPEDDIAKSYAARFPWLILEVEDPEEEINDAESWLHMIWRSYPIPACEQRQRDDRFEQCKKCVHFEKLDVQDLSAEAKRKLILLNPAKSRPEHGWCLLHGWIPSIACQLNKPAQFTDSKQHAEECWLDVPKKS